MKHFKYAKHILLLSGAAAQLGYSIIGSELYGSLSCPAGFTASGTSQQVTSRMDGLGWLAPPPWGQASSVVASELLPVFAELLVRLQISLSSENVTAALGDGYYHLGSPKKEREVTCWGQTAPKDRARI